MIEGIFPALLTPFTPGGDTLDLPRLKPYCDYLVEAGVHGVFACGTTGEGLLLRAEEKIAIVEAVMPLIRGRVKLLVQVVCADHPGTLHTARHVARLGVDAISLIQPCLYAYDEEAQFRFVASVIEVIGETPLYLYNIPHFTNNPLQRSTLERLLDAFPNVRGIKESGSLDGINQWLEYQSDRFQVVCGVDACNRIAFEKGVRALVSSTCNAQPRVFRALFDAVQASDWNQASTCQDQISRFANLLDTNWIAIIKETLRAKGIDCGSVRPPLRNLDPAETERLRHDLKTIGVI